jgi:nitroimidazol reductase NimA-like FMN-containing flavoprotein (pyridoxamine 5'-phosphate oxidase superfamily)
MRRGDREVRDPDEIADMIRKHKVCRLGMSLDGKPYVVPLNFGCTLADGRLTLFFHGAKDGRKAAALRANSAVCVEMDGEHALVEGKTACEYGYAYESVICFGTAVFIEGREEKREALSAIMRHQTGRDTDWTFGDAQLDAIAVFKVLVDSVTGKRRYSISN